MPSQCVFLFHLESRKNPCPLPDRYYVFFSMHVPKNASHGIMISVQQCNIIIMQLGSQNCSHFCLFLQVLFFQKMLSFQACKMLFIIIGNVSAIPYGLINQNKNSSVYDWPIKEDACIFLMHYMT